MSRGAAAGAGAYAFGHVVEEDGTIIARAAPVVRAVVSDRRAGVPADAVAVRFHGAVVELVADLALQVRAETGLNTVVLGGGVFGNSLLLSAVRRRLERCEFVVLSAEQLPTNDGGLGFGQGRLTGAGAVGCGNAN